MLNINSSDGKCALNKDIMFQRKRHLPLRYFFFRNENSETGKALSEIFVFIYESI